MRRNIPSRVADAIPRCHRAALIHLVEMQRPDLQCRWFWLAHRDPPPLSRALAGQYSLLHQLSQRSLHRLRVHAEFRRKLQPAWNGFHPFSCSHIVARVRRHLLYLAQQPQLGHEAEPVIKNDKWLDANCFVVLIMQAYFLSSITFP